MNAIAIIPARLASTRLPEKLILPEAKEITGKYIIEHVYNRTCEAKSIKKVIVAADDRRIYSIVKQFGGIVEMTPCDIQSGADRVAWVVKNIDSVKDLNPDIIVNVQGDEPDVSGDVIDDVVSILSDDDHAVMSTAACPIESLDEFQDPHAVKVVLDNSGDALYFSRSAIPYNKNIDGCNETIKTFNALKHIGLYAYKKEFLLRFSSLPPSKLERIEGLEQLRAISNGYKIKVAITHRNFIGIDTREDFERFLNRYRR